MEMALWWLFLNLVSTAFNGFYSMIEMACVSFNKVRLQYYVSIGKKRAVWLNYLLQHPAKLFGTTLIGVNVSTVVGSECAREFYAALGLSPDLAPLTQVALVVIFGELAPMFAARSYPEHVGMLGSPLLYASALLMTPFLWLVGLITKICQIVTGGKDTQKHIFLTQEELQKVLEEHKEITTYESDSADFNAIAANIFTLRKKTARQLMEPLKNVPMLPSNATISELHNLLKKQELFYVPIYQQMKTNIVGIALPRDLIRAPATKRVRDYAKAPWFVTQHTKAMQVLQQFRRNSQSVAVILDETGHAVGFCDLEDVTEEIFGVSRKTRTKYRPRLVMERTFSGALKVGEFNAQFGVVLDEREEMTLSELLTDLLGHHPEEGDSYYLEPFELIAKETTLLETVRVTIKTKVKS